METATGRSEGEQLWLTLACVNYFHKNNSKHSYGYVNVQQQQPVHLGEHQFRCSWMICLTRELQQGARRQQQQQPVHLALQGS
jgi:hypothetical protein